MMRKWINLTFDIHELWIALDHQNEHEVVIVEVKVSFEHYLIKDELEIQSSLQESK